MNAPDMLGRQWGPPRSAEDLASQAARVRANNAKIAATLPFDKATARQLRDEKRRADVD